VSGENLVRNMFGKLKVKSNRMHLAPGHECWNIDLVCHEKYFAFMASCKAHPISP
jgi:hypothetical protein